MITNRYQSAVMWGALLGLTLALPAAAYAQLPADTAPWSQPSARPVLGVSVVPLPPALQAHLGKVVGENRGVLVGDVLPGMPAEKAGIKPLDILITFNGQDISTPEHLAKLVRDREVGATVTLSYVRAGEVHELTVEFADKPEAAPQVGTRLLPPLERFWPIERWVTVEDADAGAADDVVSTFQAMSIRRAADGKFTARIEYMDSSKNQLHREYTGTYEEVRKAINADKELPAAQRRQLLRSLEGHAPGAALKTAPISWLRELAF